MVCRTYVGRLEKRRRNSMDEKQISRRRLLNYGTRTLGAATIVPLVTVLNACGATKKAATGSTVTLKMSSSLTVGVDSAHWVWYNKFAQLLDARTNGRIKIQYFPNNQLGQEADVVKQVKLGTIDMMISGSPIWSTLVPEVDVLDMGYIFERLDTIGKTMDGDAIELLNNLVSDKVQ